MTLENLILTLGNQAPRVIASWVSDCFESPAYIYIYIYRQLKGFIYSRNSSIQYYWI